MKTLVSGARSGFAAAVALLAVGVVPASAGSASAAQGGGPVNVTIKIPADARPNPCSAGDVIALSGVMHILMFTRSDGSGGYHVDNQVQFQGAGTSLVTNVRYMGHDSSHHSFYAGEPFPATDTTTYSTGLHARGPTDDFVMETTIHTTVNANGDATAMPVHVDLKCVG
jgi:hypothetical protein